MYGNIFLQKKLELDYRDFIDELKKERVDVIIERAYEVVIKQSLIDYLLAKDMDSDDVKALLQKGNLLDSLYDEWMESDEELYGIIGEEVDDKVKEIIKAHQKKINSKNIER